MIILPPYIGASNITSITKLCDAVVHDANEVIDCDATNLNFVDPLGLCMLSAVCHQISGNGKKIKIHNLSESMNSYLARMDLFENCNIENQNSYARHDRRDSLVEICRLENDSEVAPLASQIAHAIVGKIPDIDPHAEPDEMSGYTPSDHLLIPMEYIFSELLENALTHGKRSGYHDANVWVAAQYYPTKDVIRLATVDNGCGYLNTLNGHSRLISQTHQGAIQTALLPEVSCNNDLGLMGDSKNQGIGLTVVKDLTISAEGTISITSGDATIIQSKNSANFLSNHHWQGGIIALTIPRETLKTIEIHKIIKPYQHTDDIPDINFM